jgi:hypothetical protein
MRIKLKYTKIIQNYMITSSNLDKFINYKVIKFGLFSFTNVD